MKHFRRFTFFTFLLLSVGTKAQFGVRVFQEIPLGGAPFVLDNTISAELLMFEQMNNKRFIARGSITFINHKLRFDTIPTYGILDPGGKNTIIPGYEILKSLQEFTVAAGVDYELLDDTEIIPSIGADIVVGYYNSKYTSHVPTVEHAEAQDNSVVLGFRFRTGVTFKINDNFESFADGHYGWKLLAGYKGYAVADFGVGIRYWIFEKD